MNRTEQNDTIVGNIGNIPEGLPYFDHCFRSFFIDSNSGVSIPYRNFDDLSAAMEMYEQESYTRLRITKSCSFSGRCKYKCISHPNCNFEAKFGKRDDGQLVLKRNYLYHNDV